MLRWEVELTTVIGSIPKVISELGEREAEPPGSIDLDFVAALVPHDPRSD